MLTNNFKIKLSMYLFFYFYSLVNLFGLLIINKVYGLFAWFFYTGDLPMLDKYGIPIIICFNFCIYELLTVSMLINFRNKTQKRVHALNRDLPPPNEQFILDFEQLQSQFPVSLKLCCAASCISLCCFFFYLSIEGRKWLYF